MTDAPKETVGFIGLGIMGRPMAKHLLARGYGVVGYDPVPAAGDKARADGVRVLGSAREVAAACDLAIVVVGIIPVILLSLAMRRSRPGSVVAKDEDL